jgi:uncharacterized protein
MARPSKLDPLRLDVAAFAADAGTLDGRWPLAGFERITADRPADAPLPDADVTWSATGERRRGPGGVDQVWLHLQVQARVWRECQRCLHPVALPLDLSHHLLFVPGEDQAAALDAELEDDVLALTRALNLHDLVEDELLLALPIVPTHEACEIPLPPQNVAGDADADVPEHPFAALAGLRRGPPQAH